MAEHRRTYGRGELILDPLHYLVTLGCRPAALDHAPVYRDWRLPAAFGRLREHFEQKHGSAGGARQFVRVLQLLSEHPVERVQQAMAQSQSAGDADSIIRRTQQMARHELVLNRSPATEASTFDASSHVQVPLPELDRFNQLLTAGATE